MNRIHPRGIRLFPPSRAVHRCLTFVAVEEVTGSPWGRSYLMHTLAWTTSRQKRPSVGLPRPRLATYTRSGPAADFAAT